MKCPEDIPIEVIVLTGCSHIETRDEPRCRLELPAGRKQEVSP